MDRRGSCADLVKKGSCWDADAISSRKLNIVCEILKTCLPWFCATLYFIYYASPCRPPVDGRPGRVERVVPQHEVDAVARDRGRRVAGQLCAAALHRHHPRDRLVALPVVVVVVVADCK